MRSYVLAAVILVWISPAFAEEPSDVEILKKQVEALQEQVRALQGQNKATEDGAISRFDGRWEGKIIGDKRYDCRDGDVRATVEGGKLEGSRWFFAGNVAPIKGKIQTNGAYSGYQNRIDVSGQFAEATATMWYVSGSCEDKIELKKVGGL